MNCAMREAEIGWAQSVCTQHSGVCHTAQCQHNRTGFKRREFMLKVGIALFDFLQGRFVLRGNTTHGIGNPAVNQA